MSLECKRCHHISSKTSNLITHLQREKPCLCLFSDEPREDIIKSLTKCEQSCEYCNKTYVSKKRFENHMENCFRAKLAKMSEVVKASSTTPPPLSQSTTTTTTTTTDSHNVVVDNSHNNTTTNTTTNNTTTNNNNNSITINNFGSEDRSYVKNETMRICLENAQVMPLIMDVYFNKAHPENNTIRLKSEKLSRVIVHSDGQWIECDMNSSIDKMMEAENGVLTRFYWSSDFYGNSEIDDKMKMTALENINQLYKMQLKYFEQRRQVHSILKNAKSRGAAP